MTDISGNGVSDDEEDEEFDVAYHIAETAKQAEYLRGATWRWTKWTPTPAVLYQPETGPATLYDPRSDEDAPYDPSRESPSATLIAVRQASF